MQGKILVYAFTHQTKRNISEEIARQLVGVSVNILNVTTNITGVTAFKGLIEHITTTQYSYIVGLGIFSSKGHLRVETKAKNKFRNSVINETAPVEYAISEFITSDLPHSERMGNSWCNFSAYMLRHTISTRKLALQNAFIHIPDLPENIVVYSSQIQDILNDL